MLNKIQFNSIQCIILKHPMCNSKTCRVGLIVKHVMCHLQKRIRSFKTCMLDNKHVYVSLLKHKCIKVKHVSVSCFYSEGISPWDTIGLGQ